MSDYEDDDFESEISPTSNKPTPRGSSSNNKPASRAQSSTLNKRNATTTAGSNPSSDRKPLITRRTVTSESSRSSARLTREEEAQASTTLLADLRRQNEELRSQLLSMNRLLDEQLTQKGQKACGRVQPVPKSKESMTPADRLSAKNEHQRRVNNDFMDKLRQAGNLDRVNELMNTVGALNAELADLRSENRSVENIYANQMAKWQICDKVERELSGVRSTHNDEVRTAKEATRREKEKREKEMDLYKHNMRAVERMEEKVKIQESIGGAVHSVAEMQEQVEEKDRMIDALKYQVAVLSRTNTNDKKRAKQKATKTAKEIQDLQEEADYLRRKLGIAADLDVDTRI